ncbi:immunoglobulin-like domain-containing protein [Maribacter forsetii]|uniref:immunoglobulin-like domain-containing protein n=1 Tax=Maribacter forsetii TaxID=444515 RepID=UPI0005686CE9|nr:immunoglobulin-like domain-containing protein [Maribacter forsetii]
MKKQLLLFYGLYENSIIQNLLKTDFEPWIVYRSSMLLFTFFISSLSLCGQSELSITPSISNVSVGDNFDLIVEVNNATSPIDVAEGYLTFNNSVLQVTNIELESTLISSFQGPPISNNNLGTISYLLAAFSSPPSGDFNLLTISFIAIADGNANIDFYDPDGVADTVLFSAGSQLLDQTYGATVNVGTSNQPPTANYTLVVGNGAQSLDVYFDASSSTDTDGNNTIFSYTWNFGDSSPNVTGQIVNHTYLNSGTYQVSLTVEDDKGLSDTITKEVSVIETIGNSIPTISPIADQILFEGDDLDLNNIIEISDIDNDNLIVTISSISNEPQELQSNNNGQQTDPYPFDANNFITETVIINTAGSYVSDLNFLPTFGDGGSNGDSSAVYTVSITVTDEDLNTIVESFEVTVNDVPQVLSTTEIVLIEAESYDNQGNLGGGVGVGVEVGAKTVVGFTGPGDFVEYTIDVPTTGLYEFNFNSSNGTAQVGTLMINNEPTATVIVPQGASWAAFGDYAATVELIQGIQTLRLDWSGGPQYYSNTDFFNVSFVGLSNIGPEVSIITPEDGIAVSRGVEFSISGSAESEGGDISSSISWSSDTDTGFLPTPNIGESVSGVFLEPGIQNLKAFVSDSEGLTSFDEINIEVSCPQVSFNSPSEGSVLTNASVDIEVSALDLLFGTVANPNEHFHFFINPSDINNIDVSKRISTAPYGNQTVFTFDENSGDLAFDGNGNGIVEGANTIVVVAAQANHVEFDCSGAKAILNFTVNSLIADTEAPIITLNGEAVININLGDDYIDAGATATDNVDTSVTVNTSGIVDSNTEGVYTIIYSATDLAGNSSSETRTINVIAGPFQICVASGSEGLTAFGRTFIGDPNNLAPEGEGFSRTNGKKYSGYNGVISGANTTDELLLFQKEIYGGQNTANPSFKYSVPVTNGSYQVDLYLAEVYHQSSGGRVFDILLEGEVILDEYDLVDPIKGGLNTNQTAIIRTYYVNVIDGAIEIEVGPASTDNGKISGFCITELSAANLMPTSDIGNLSAEALQPIVWPLNISDSENDNLSIVLNTLPTGLSLDAANNQIIGTPDVSSIGIHVVNAIISDGNSSPITEQFEIEITEPSSTTPPLFVTELSTQTNFEGDSPLGLLVIAEDPDGGIITLSDNGTLPLGLSIDPVSGVISGTIIEGAAKDSPYNVIITATDDQLENTITSFEWIVNTEMIFPVCVNVGNQPSSNAFGKTFSSDEYLTSEATAYNKLNTTFNGIVSGSDEEVLFLSENYNDPLNYAIPTGNGAFTVELYFAELYIGVAGGGTSLGVGDRVFDINVEGSVESDVDLFSEYGPLTSATKTFAVTVSDGILNIDLDAIVDNAKLSGFCIIETSNYMPNAAPVLTIEPSLDILDCDNDGEDFILTANAVDNEQGDLSSIIIWKDENDVQVGVGSTLEVSGVIGSKTYIAQVQDATPSLVIESVTVNSISNTQPLLTDIIAAPQQVVSGDTISFSSTASDNEDDYNSLIVSWSSDIETDNGGDLGSGESITAVLNVEGTHLITASVTDSCGVTTIVTASVVVNGLADTESPEIVLNGSEIINLEVGDVYTELGAIVSDNIDLDLVASIGGDTVDTSVENQYIITYNAEDAAGNVAVQVIRTVNVNAAPDIESPVIVLNGDSIIDLTVGDVYQELGANVSDNIDLDLVATISGDTVDTSVENQYIITYDAEDSAGNAAVQVIRTVNVNAVPDTESPLIVLIGDAIVELNVGDTYQELGATVTDNVDNSLTVVIGGDSVDTNSPGSYIVSYDAIDSAGNQAIQVIRNINVEALPDNTAPVITLNGEAIVNLTIGDVYTELNAAAIDNIDSNVSVIIGGDTVDTSVVSTYIITYDATDAAGNIAVQKTRTVNVYEEGVFLSVNPMLTNVEIGDEFELLIMVQTGAQFIDLAEAHLSFDTSILQVNNLTPITDILSVPLVPASFDNEQGTIDYGAGNLLPPFPSGNFNLLKINFTAINSGETSISFVDPIGAPSTIVTFNSTNVLTATNNGSVIVANEPELQIIPNSLSTTLFVDETVSLEYLLESNNGSILPTGANILILDNETSNISTWSTTDLNVVQGVTNQILFNSTGLAPGFYGATLTASDVPGYNDISIPITFEVLELPSLVFSDDNFEFVLNSNEQAAGSFNLTTTDGSQVPEDLLISVLDDATLSSPTWLVVNTANDGFSINTEELPPGDYSATITASGTNVNNVISIVSLTVSESIPCARVAFDTGGNIGNSSTYGGGLVITNNSTGNVTITSISIDLSTAVFPNIVFDPIGTAGDATAQCVTIVSQTGGDSNVGLTIPGNNGTGSDIDCTEPFSGPNGPGGYNIMTLNFNDFEAGETVDIAVDVDPRSIEGFNSAGNAGAISGLELIGTTVTVTYSNDSSSTRQLFQVGNSEVNSENYFSPSTLQCNAPTISLESNSDNFSINSTEQTISVNGPTNANIKVLIFGTSIEDLDSYVPIDIFEMNKTQSLQQFSGVLDGTGNLNLDVNFTGLSNDQVYYVVSTVIPDSEDCGPSACDISNILKVKLDFTPPIITLNGPDPQVIELGEGYTELGATTDDGSPVDIDSSSFMDVVGSYDIVYNSTDGINEAEDVVRIVEVVDTTAPVITLNGANPQVIELGEGYTELGATTDDGSPVDIDSSSFMDVVGSYNIVYSSTDGINESEDVVRVVDVIDTTAPVITLNGANPQVIELGEGYTELGATTDDGSLVTIDSGSFMDAVGSYDIVYSSTDGINEAEDVVRRVEVVEVSGEFNTPDSDINLALLEDAVLGGTVNGGRGTMEAILYDPVADNYYTPTRFNEYGVTYKDNLGRPGADEGFRWQVDWSSTKRINYITFGGTYPNQPQPNSMWRISYERNGIWTVLEEGKGGWIDSGIYEWGGGDQYPIEADALRVQVYSDGNSDLVSIHLRGRGGISGSVDDSSTATKATLIQYLPGDHGPDTTAPVITLNGANPQVIELGEGYTELGATTDDGSPVDIDSSSFMDVVGSYNIVYSSTDGINESEDVVRVVDVIDTTAPIITLNGANPQVIELGDGYTELGASTDDGSLVTIDSGSFMDAVGSYDIVYSSTDGINEAEDVVRRVEVVEVSGEFNTPDSDINLALLEDAVLGGTVNGGRGTMEAILYDPVADNYYTPTRFNEYGVTYKDNLGRPGADEGFRWQVDWSSTKRINYITFGGTYPNQPQPNSMWRISYERNGIWTVLEEGKGGWIDSGIYEWGGGDQYPIEADALRVQVYSDGNSDLVSIHLRGRGGISQYVDDSSTAIKATLIQYLPGDHGPDTTAPVITLNGANPQVIELGEGYTELGATTDDGSPVDIDSSSFMDVVGSYNIVYSSTDGINEAEEVIRRVEVVDVSGEFNVPDSDINLALLEDAVLGGTVNGGRGTMQAILYDPVADNYYTPTRFNEYGVGRYDNLGRPGADDGFRWQVDWSSTKRINYITFGGTYPNQPQPNSMWRISYLRNGTWTVLEEGRGGWIDSGIYEWGGPDQYPIEADALRVQVYSDGNTDLVSIHLRGRGGISGYVDDSATATKATLIQYLPVSSSTSKSITTVESFNKMTVFPNPAVSETSLSFELPTTVEEIQVFDVTGRLVRTIKGGEIDERGEPVNVQELPVGVYFLKTQDVKGQQFQEQMVIKRQ